MRWKKCPKCGDLIPVCWNHHKKCGWKVPLNDGSELARKMEKALVSAIEIGRKIKRKYLEEALQIDLTKVALTLFIRESESR